WLRLMLTATDDPIIQRIECFRCSRGTLHGTTQPRLYALPCPVRRVGRTFASDRIGRQVRSALLVALEGPMGLDRPVRTHRPVDRDVLELRIAVRVIGPLARLAIGLATILHLPQQVCHYPLARLEPLLRQRFDQMPLTAADPQQWRARIAADGVLDQRLKCRWQARLMRHGGLAPGPRPAYPLDDPVAG